jgi:hypothetical protein
MDDMELHARSHGVTPLRDRARPIPRDVARSLSSLANLIDDSIDLRGIPAGIRGIAAAHLGLAGRDVIETSCASTGVTYQFVATALAADLAAFPPDFITGADADEGPEYERIAIAAGEHVHLPLTLAAAWGDDGPVGCRAVVSTVNEWGRGIVTTVWTDRAGVVAAQTYLDDLLVRGQGPLNPFRGRIVRASQHGLIGVMFSAATVAPADRTEVVLPPELWGEIDRNVHGLFRAHDRLRAAGLARNRGLLLAGPPGTGKTAVCRVLAHEVAGTATVIFVEARALSHSVVALYHEAAHLAPALVVLEDVDLVVGRRGLHGNPDALQDFLVALDGGMSDHEGVVTVATTNAPEAIDAAARRAARFDAVLEVPHPPTEARVAIIGRYLAGLGALAAGVDPARVAAATAGWSGAELRELVSRAVIVVSEAEHDGAGLELDTALLVRLAGSRPGDDAPGLYL